MATLTARQIIKKEYGDSKNFITPHRIHYGKITPTTAYEISTGTGFENEVIFGLSIVSLLPNGTTKRRFKLSGCFRSGTDLDNHIKRIKNIRNIIKGG